MANTSVLDPIIGGGQIATSYSTVDAVGAQRVALGKQTEGIDSSSYAATYVYGKAGGTIAAGNIVVFDAGWSAVVCPTTANTGRAIAVALNAMTVGQFGWFQVTGMAVMSASASVAAGTPIGATTAGNVGANSAGRQILGAVSVVASTGTTIKSSATTNGSTNLVVPNTDGWFVGIALTGTGIPASTTVTAIAADGKSVTMNNAATANGTGVAVTGTNTGFLLAHINRPCIQSAIT